MQAASIGQAAKSRTVFKRFTLRRLETDIGLGTDSPLMR